MTVAVVGAGVTGRLLALECARRGWRTRLFDAGRPEGTGSCSFSAAGQLAPFAERVDCDPLITRLGIESLARWPDILGGLGERVFFQREGTLIVACAADRPERDRLERRVSATGGAYQRITGGALRVLEPQLDPRFDDALYFPQEGQLDARACLRALGETLQRRGVRCDWGTPVEPRGPGELATGSERLRFDWIADCRGLGAREWKGLRGVRGEMAIVHAPEVELRRPVRLVHARHPLYVAPRPDGRYLLGATCLESQDQGPVRVRSALELLSTAFTLHSGFGEAAIEQWVTGLRPALADHRPRVRHCSGIVRINGMYRHGFLVGPRVAELVADFLESPGESPLGEIGEEAAA